jgi:CHAD domain-containing protein
MQGYRQEAQRELVKSLKIINVAELIKYISRYLRKRRYKMELAVRQSSLAAETSSEHMHAILAEHEQHVRKLEENSSDAKGMHHLRLSIKTWRYLFSEFFNLKNDELEYAQGLLGDIHDLDKLSEWLLNDGSNIIAISNLKQRRATSRRRAGSSAALAFRTKAQRRAKQHFETLIVCSADFASSAWLITPAR